MKDVKPSELNQRRYSLPLRLNLLMMASVVGAVICIVVGHLGDGIAKKELCFYPKSARIHDAPLEAEGDTKRLLLGNKYCRYEQRSENLGWLVMSPSRKKRLATELLCLTLTVIKQNGEGLKVITLGRISNNKSATTLRNWNQD